MSSANLDKFKKDFDALAKSLPKPSTDPEKSEETKEVEKKAEGIFKANLSKFRSTYGGESHIDELKHQLNAKKLSLTDPLNPPTTTPTDLAITATKIKSLEEIDHLKTDKISDLRTVLSSPYQERIDSRLEAVDMPPGLMREIPAELFRQVLENTTPEDFGITSFPCTPKDEDGKPIRSEREVKALADGKTFSVQEEREDAPIRFLSLQGELVDTFHSRMIHRLEDQDGRSINNYAETVSSDRKTFVAKRDGGGAYLVNAQGKIIPFLDEKGRFIYCADIKVSADGQTVITEGESSGTGRNIVRLHSIEGGMPIATFLDEEGKPIRCESSDRTIFFADGKTVLVVRENTYIAHLYSIEGGMPIATLLDEEGKPIKCAFSGARVSANGEVIIAGEQDTDIIRRYDAQGGMPIATLQNEKGKPIRYCSSIRISADGKAVVVETQYSGSYLFGPKGGRPITTFPDEKGKPIQSFNMRLSSDGETIVVQERDTNIIRLYSAQDGKPIAILQDEEGRPVHCFIPYFSSEEPVVAVKGETVVAIEMDRGVTRVYSAQNGKPIATLLDEEGRPLFCKTITVSADEKTVVAMEKYTGIARLYSIQGQLIPLLDEQKQPMRCGDIKVSADGKTVVTVEEYTRIVRFFNAKGLFKRTIEELSFNELALIRVLESVKKNWKAEHPDEPFSTSPIQLTCALLETHLTAKDFTKENIKQTKALFKQTYEWVSSTLESTKSKSLIPQVGTCHDYIRETYALEENPPNLGKAPPYMVALAKVGRSLEETDRFHEEMIPPTTFWGVLTSWISPGASKEG